MKLKHLLTVAPITAFLNFNLSFRLDTNTSTLGLGAILAQMQDRKERIICCALHGLLQTEKNYPATKLECLVFVGETAKLRPYLMSNRFDIYTDHYSLHGLKSMRAGSALLHFWPVVLEEFNFIIHQPGKDQGHVDGLSHLPVEGSPPEVEEAAPSVQMLSSEEAGSRRGLGKSIGGWHLWRHPLALVPMSWATSSGSLLLP